MVRVTSEAVSQQTHEYPHYRELRWFPRPGPAQTPGVTDTEYEVLVRVTGHTSNSGADVETDIRTSEFLYLDQV